VVQNLELSRLLEACPIFCFFFQAEDGIRDRNVTGVQTCALPIYQMAYFILLIKIEPILRIRIVFMSSSKGNMNRLKMPYNQGRRSEERRVGKECRSGWGPVQWQREECNGDGVGRVISVYCEVNT